MSKALFDLDSLMSAVTEEEIKKKERETNSSQADENFLQLKKGNTYRVRFLFNVKNKIKTFTDYEEYGFTSVTGGGYIYAGRTPASVGRKDIVHDLQWKTYSEAKAAGDEAGMKRSYTLFPQKKQMVNVLVVDDPVNPENNGTVKILRYSAKVRKDGTPTSPLYGKIYDAVAGEEKEEIGKKAFDLTANGVDFAIKVEENQGGWHDYSNSKFKYPSDLGLSDAEIAEIYENTYDLEEFIPEAKSDAELKALLDEHWFGVSSGSSLPETDLGSDDDDDTPLFDGADDDDLDGLTDDMDSYLDGVIENDDED